jgi:primosomal protein N' (replication factor Y) (superfamily II helicase)
MYAELVINIEAALGGTFHYFVPTDLQRVLQPGHLVEVEFGRRLAQGIVVAFDTAAPVAETKPIISLIDAQPVVLPWQIELAQWMSLHYMAPLNACLRLMLPPGLTRWADVVLDINPAWDGKGRLTEQQRRLVELLQARGDLRSRQISRALGGKQEWQTAANQLAQRGIVRKASLLDPPRIQPKQIRTAELTASWGRIYTKAARLGRPNRRSDVLLYLAQLDDPLPAETAVLIMTDSLVKHLVHLEAEGLIKRTPGQRLLTPLVAAEQAPPVYAELLRRLPASLEALEGGASGQVTPEMLIERGLAAIVDQAPTVSLTVTRRAALAHGLALRAGSKYFEVLEFLSAAAQPVDLQEIYARTAASMTHLRKLESLGLIRFGAEEVWRDPLADRDFVPAEAPSLTLDQARVWGRIKMAMLANADGDLDLELDADLDAESVRDGATDSAAPFLLHGVTGSGKTEIYMRAIDFALQAGRQAIVLVPEIALTPQTVRRFAARFPGAVAVLHSRLSDGERYDTWRRARLGLIDIVVGPRSALFTPLKKLGVIVVDEEHDQSYKQTPPVPPPYYHARETAVAIGRITGATVIMGSATPDVVTYHRARGGRYTLLELPKRIMGHRRRVESQAERLQLASHYNPLTDDFEDALTIPLPPIQVVDLRQELRAGNRSIFSRALEQALTETLARGEQAILFLNRRGTATFVICRDCGHVLKCPRCAMPLTYHRPQAALVCHHCGRQETPRETCPQCSSHRIRYFGLGTEEVAQRVAQRWPEARITRWDRDTTAGKDSHETLLAGFIQREADVLVGTQMIAKGLDLPFVTLVGVISADVSLGLPDYRTGERAFQVLAQVAGRAGRGLLGGRVIIQTYQPEHYAIQAAAEHDYATFYIDEMRFRTQHMLPPFRRLTRLLLIDPVNDRGRREAEKLAKGLRLHVREKALAATEILGPTPPFFNRIDGRYRWQIIIRSPDPARLLEDFPIPKPWIIDIDPESTL